MRPAPRGCRLCIGLACAIGLTIFMAAAPANAWNSKYQHFHLRLKNNTGGNVNDMHVRVQGRSGGGPWSPVVSLGAMTLIPGWAPTGVVVAGNSTVYNFAGFTLGPGANGWFNVYFCIDGSTPPWESNCWFQWTLNGVNVGQEVFFGFCVSSPAKIGNPSTKPDGSVNTSSYVIRNLQFAQSSHAFSNTETTLDNPAVVAVFNSSPDPIRPGPYTVSPGNCLDIVPDLHSSITGPVNNGATVLARGLVEDQVGQQYDFVVQWEGLTPAGMPMWSTALAILAFLSLAGLGTFVVARRQRVA